MKITIAFLFIAFSVIRLSAAEISTNFWDKCSERAVSLHRYIGEVSDYCSKEEVKELKINNNQALVVIQLLETHLQFKATTVTPLSDLKKAVKVSLFLTLISEKSTAVTSRILAFSKLTDEQKRELIEKTDRANLLITKLTTDVAEYIHNVAELGL